MTLGDGLVIIGVFALVGGAGVGTSTILDLMNQRDQFRAQASALAHRTPGPTITVVTPGGNKAPTSSVIVHPRNGNPTTAPVTKGNNGGSNNGGSNNGAGGISGGGNGNGGTKPGVTQIIYVKPKTPPHTVTPSHPTVTPPATHQPMPTPPPSTTPSAPSSRSCSNGSVITLRVAILPLPCTAVAVGGTR